MLINNYFGEISGVLVWKHVSIYINKKSQVQEMIWANMDRPVKFWFLQNKIGTVFLMRIHWQVIMKVKSKHVGGAFSKNSKCKHQPSVQILWKDLKVQSYFKCSSIVSIQLNIKAFQLFHSFSLLISSIYTHAFISEAICTYRYCLWSLWWDYSMAIQKREGKCWSLFWS